MTCLNVATVLLMLCNCRLKSLKAEVRKGQQTTKERMKKKAAQKEKKTREAHKLGALKYPCTSGYFYQKYYLNVNVIYQEFNF